MSLLKQISYRRPGLLLIALTFGTAPLFGQTLTLVPSALIIPAQFQHYYDSAETVYLPEGFTAQVYYTGTLSGPRFMAFDPQGNLCVADDNNSIVVRLRDTNNDGIADTAITIASSTDGAHSIAFHGGDLFTAAPDHTYRYSEPDVNGVFTSRQLFIDSVDSAPQGVTNHTTRTILFDDFSNALFMSVGSGCNACRETDTMRASIVRYDQDGTHPTLFASGLRNAVGLAMDSSHHLWATVAERNNQGQDLPGDLITGIEQNQFYGWPLAFGNHEWDDFNLDSEYQAMLPITHSDSVTVAAMRVPDAMVAAHSTPLGITYFQDTTLPSNYKNSFFVAIHGSFDGVDGRSIANGSKVVLLQNNGGQWSVQDFCTGFLTDSVHYLRWARPCGIILDGKGNIYFSSDHTSPHSQPAIFRIHYDASNSVSYPGEGGQQVPEIQISPNPVSNTLTISGAPSNLKVAILTNMVGENVKELSNPHSSSFILDLARLPSGIYLLRLVLPNGIITRKIVKE